MKILQSIYEKYLDRKVELEALIEEANNRKNIASAEGDLSENADYSKAFSDLELYSSEYMDVIEIIETGEPVEEVTNFTEIVVGSKFNLVLELEATPIDEGETRDIGVYKLQDDWKNGITILKGVVTLGGPSDNYVYEGVISTDSLIGRFLLGKPLGEYITHNEYGERIKLSATKC